MILSFIIPAYNAEKHIGKCLESLLQQDLAHSQYEIIIVNDGSTDNTFSIASEYQKKHSLSIEIVNQANQGVSVARNVGVQHANGDYIWFIDVDDTICPNCLSVLLECCHKFNCDLFGTGPSIPYTDSFPEDFTPDKYVSRPYSGKEWILTKNPFIGPWAYIIKKTFWENNHLSFIPDTRYEDVECMSRAFLYAQCIYILNKFSVYNYVQHSESFMNSDYNQKKLFDKIVVSKSLRKFSSTIQDLDIKNYYERICTDMFISGISMIVKYNVNVHTARRFIREAKECYPTYLYATSPIQKIYQRIIVYFPLLYIWFRKIV